MLRWEEFKLRPGFVDVLRAVRARRYESVIVSNQRGVALGEVSREAVDDIHRRLRRLLTSEYGVTLLDVLYCPHDEGQCDCRKPRPGMLLEAARRHGIDLSRSWMIGDQESDVGAGRAAGCRTVLVSERCEDSAADFRVRDMLELRDLIGREF